MKQKAALLMGATGLVGCECLKLLTDDAHYHRIVVPTRTPPAERVGSRKVHSHKVDFERIGDDRHILTAFCGFTAGRIGGKN
jgi:NAD dependent epimerase/dehydratase family enzyme